MKPPYSIPSMSEIKAIPWNGFNVASTFSGCGGSCLGYRMAGFRVVWANEFVPIAQESYRANSTTDCFLDCRDIKLVRPDDILRQTGIKVGELDLFDGSPPCQAFSNAGAREKGWGRKKKYEHGAQQCNEQLFDEYIRLLRGLQPKVFVAENVAGLVRGTAKGFFLDILKKLKDSGYVVSCKVLDAQWLGVPQTRQRVIFVGVRCDLGLSPKHPAPLSYQYTIRDALPWIVKSTYDTKGIFRVKETANSPHPCITCSNMYHFEIEAETDISRFAIGKEWDKIKAGEASEKYFSLIKAHPDRPSPCILASHGQPGIASVVHPTEKRKFTIAEVKQICSFPQDFKLAGSYAQQWERLGNSVPPLMAFRVAEVVRDEILAKAGKHAN
jgi:DNA (cytosine-5)-methyltransferase 1